MSKKTIRIRSHKWTDSSDDGKYELICDYEESEFNYGMFLHCAEIVKTIRMTPNRINDNKTYRYLLKWSLEAHGYDEVIFD